MRILVVFLFFLITVSISSNVRGQDYHPIPEVPHPEQFVEKISRSAYLLASSTEQDPKEVRILVYGQSISAQEWWKQVKSFLEERYPNARINMMNKAIGGFSSDRLKLTVDNDVTTFYPDLILFHDYGGEPDYEEIIRTIRSRTTAEVVLQTDHIAVGQDEKWHGQHNDVWLPALSRKYNLALADVRTAWKEYLSQNNLQAKELLTDGVHLNSHGNYLMAGILNKYFEALPTIVNPASTPVTIFKAGQDFKVKRNRVELPVSGNRIDLLLGSTPKSTKPITVKLDGRNPSALLDCYYYTRPTPVAPDNFFLNRIGQVLKLTLSGEPQEEAWTLTVTGIDSVKQQVQFSLKGSRTGEDGVGTSDALFTSNSGRIKIGPDSWFFRRSPGDFGQFSWLKPGDTLKWQVKSMCKDKAVPTQKKMTIIQGVANKTHKLQLSGKSLSSLKEIRVYQPPIKE